MWKEIPDYEGLYEINEYGQVRSMKTGKIKITRQPDEYYLYPYIILYKNAQQKKFGIHQLVARTFIPNPDNLPVVMHKDNNKLNPHVSNLKWGTVIENVHDAIKDGLSGIKNKQPYQIYDEERNVRAECTGYRDVIDKVGYGTKAMFVYALRENSKFKYGEFKGCKVRKVIKGVIYDD